MPLSCIHFRSHQILSQLHELCIQFVTYSSIYWEIGCPSLNKTNGIFLQGTTDAPSDTAASSNRSFMASLMRCHVNLLELGRTRLEHHAYIIKSFIDPLIYYTAPDLGLLEKRVLQPHRKDKWHLCTGQQNHAITNRWAALRSPSFASWAGWAAWLASLLRPTSETKRASWYKAPVPSLYQSWCHSVMHGKF